MAALLKNTCQAAVSFATVKRKFWDAKHLCFKEVDSPGTGEKRYTNGQKKTFLTINYPKKSTDCLFEELYNPITQKCCRKHEMHGCLNTWNNVALNIEWFYCSNWSIFTESSISKWFQTCICCDLLLWRLFSHGSHE